jgi:uncharacterized protein YggT (Ycf19 family)
VLVQFINIFIYLTLILFLSELARADSYNKISRVIKILLYPFLLIFNIHYKKINIGLLILASLLAFILYYISFPSIGFAAQANLAIFKVSMVLLGILKFVIIAGVIISWLFAFGLNSNNSITSVLRKFFPGWIYDFCINFTTSFTSLIQQLYEVTVSVFRNIIPPAGGFDLSPLIAIFAFQFAERLLSILLFEILPNLT